MGSTSINGTVQLANAVSEQARTDLTTAYNTISALTPTSDLTGQVLGSAGLLSLTPGVYRYSSSAQLTGGLTLNAMGDPNALFVFLIGSTLTTASNSSVQVINGGANNGVYWQVGSSATLGTGTSFAGNILALTSITMDTGTNILCGRGLAINGAVTLDQNIVSGNCASGGDFGSGRTDFASSGFAGGFAPANVEAGGTDTGIPEPGTAAMLSLGFLVTFFVRRSQKRGVR